jgi:hypothetical protein
MEMLAWTVIVLMAVQAINDKKQRGGGRGEGFQCLNYGMTGAERAKSE